jgi:hypothetical protein
VNATTGILPLTLAQVQDGAWTTKTGRLDYGPRGVLPVFIPKPFASLRATLPCTHLAEHGEHVLDLLGIDLLGNTELIWSW